MSVILPLDTIVRILDHADTGPRSGSEGSSGLTTSAPSGEAKRPLANSIISALKKARNDKANTVGPLEPDLFNELSAWCRNVGLTTRARLLKRRSERPVDLTHYTEDRDVAPAT